MKTRLLLSATLVLLPLVVVRCGMSVKDKTSLTFTDVNRYPTGSLRTNSFWNTKALRTKEICRIYASDTLHWNEVDRIMCGD